MVLPAQDALHLGQVFAGVGVRQAGVGMAGCGVEQRLGFGQTKTRAMQQAVANGHTDAEVVRLRQPSGTRHLQGRHKQPEARDGNRERVQVHAGHRVQRLLRDVHRVAAWLVALPLGHQPMEAPQQKVA